GDGVGDCFYILACLMIGQGVPEQLVASTTVYAPGQVIKEVVQIASRALPSSEPQDPYIAPPVPEPDQIIDIHPGIEFEAPPVPEPKLTELVEPTSFFKSEPEIEFEAPPVPEPAPVRQPQNIPDISIPEPSEIEFKTPDEILNKSDVISELETLARGDNIYKPKTIPFTSNIPEPAPPPKEFQSPYSEKPIESSHSHTPFRVIKREEDPKPQPASMTFEPRPKPQSDVTNDSPLFKALTPPASSSDSLIDYMPKAIINKKEKKKEAKEKKKQDKENAKIEKVKKTIERQEKQENLFEDMKKSKKDKKEKQPKPNKSNTSQTPAPSKPKPEINSLFQTLTQKTEDMTPDQSVTFMPFTVENKTKEEGMSKLRIIPNVADVEADSNTFSAFTYTQPIQEEKPKKKSKDLLICEQCGSILSSDYAFCNKCGNKL
ncbi:MAG: zinc ribbon domain-containing protein, partial [Candidatus Lokiarchaeota archaeon]|nr:zinc ribbon domain-containing protein [Candidatus Lokiarchaeota archaeon]